MGRGAARGVDPRKIPKLARWAAAMAVALVLAVAGLIAYRARRESKQVPRAPSAVPANVEQGYSGFTYSKVEGQQTLFTIHAAQATQYKQGNRSLLQDVEIVVYGTHGERHDVIKTHSCDYVPSSGAVVCRGKVSLDLASAGPAGQVAAAGEPAAAGKGGRIHIEATGVQFERDTGEAFTSAPVVFQFPQGHGSAVGVTYSVSSKQIALGRNVDLTLDPSSAAGAATTIGAAGGMLYNRGSGTLDLRGPVNVAQPDRTLETSALEVVLSPEMRPERAVAGPNATVEIRRGGGTVTFQAVNTEILFDGSGRAAKIEAAGLVMTSVSGAEAASAKGAGRLWLESQKGSVTFDPVSEQPREMIASGDVRLESLRNGATSRLSTDALYLTAATTASVGATHVPAQAPPRVAGRRGTLQRAPTGRAGGGLPIVLAKAWTPGRASGESEANGNEMRFDAGRLSASFGAGNELRSLDAGAGVHLEKQQAGRNPVTSQADALRVDFVRGQWDRAEETGHVRLSEASGQAALRPAAAGSGGQASANRLVWLRESDRIELAGDAQIRNGSGETLADTIEWNRQSGELRATGDVRSVYFGDVSPGAAAEAGRRAAAVEGRGTLQRAPTALAPGGALTGPANVVADALEANSATGVAIFSGRARLWQGDRAVQADRIELRRQRGELVATGGVLAAFPQAALKTAGGTSAPQQPKGVELWRVRAQELDYQAAPRASARRGTLQGAPAGQATLTGGVEAWSSSAQIFARRLTLSLERDARGRAALANAEAAGGVVVRQGERWARSDRADYDAKEGKFVMSGGKPTLEDASGDRVTGDTLTFYQANDTILIASVKGSRKVKSLPESK